MDLQPVQQFREEPVTDLDIGLSVGNLEQLTLHRTNGVDAWQETPDALVVTLLSPSKTTEIFTYYKHQITWWRRQDRILKVAITEARPASDPVAV